MGLNVFIVAGEASSDQYAAKLVTEFKRLHPEAKFRGVGGIHLERVGAEIIVPSSQLSVVGVSDWIDRFGEVLGAYKKTQKHLMSQRPDLAILLDLPDFNLRIAKRLKQLGVPVVYYISPQVWAWRKYRVKTIKKLVDKMLVLFPFEKEFYDRQGVESVFVGHPLLEMLSGRSVYRNQEDVQVAPRIAVLPGSRKSEIKFHIELVKETIVKIRLKYPAAEIKIPIATTLSKSWFTSLLGKGFEFISVEEGSAHEVMEWADVALVASGTATLECALIGTPFLIYYRASRSSAWVFRHLVRYKGFIGMPNLLYGKEIAKEFFQEKANAENLNLEVDLLLQSEQFRREKSIQLLACREILGSKGASQRAAHEVHRLLKKFDSNRNLNRSNRNYVPEPA